MKIYVPIYDNGHKILELDSSACRPDPWGGFFCNGGHYHDAFTTREGVEMYWQKQYYKANKFRYEIGKGCVQHG